MMKIRAHVWRKTQLTAIHDDTRVRTLPTPGGRPMRHIVPNLLTLRQTVRVKNCGPVKTRLLCGYSYMNLHPALFMPQLKLSYMEVEKISPS